MKITARQLRQIIKEELLREARNPLVAQLQALMDMPASEQDGIWGGDTDAAFANTINKYLGRTRGIQDSLGNSVDPASIAPDWNTIAPIISGSLIGKSGAGRRIPALTGDTQGAIDFIKFLKNDLSKAGAVFPRTQWSPYDDDGQRHINRYKYFYFDSWPKWTYYDSSRLKWVYDVSPADLLANFDQFEADIISGKLVFIGGAKAAIQTSSSFAYIIDDLDTLGEFFKIQT